MERLNKTGNTFSYYYLIMYIDILQPTKPGFFLTHTTCTHTHLGVTEEKKILMGLKNEKTKNLSQRLHQIPGRLEDDGKVLQERASLIHVILGRAIHLCAAFLDIS